VRKCLKNDRQNIALPLNVFPLKFVTRILSVVVSVLFENKEKSRTGAVLNK